MDQEFTILENRLVGRNFYRFRKINDVKASDLATHLCLSESAYTKYERGESQITIDMVQKVAEYLKVDPINIISNQVGTFYESGNNSPGAIIGNNNYQAMTSEQVNMM